MFNKDTRSNEPESLLAASEFTDFLLANANDCQLTNSEIQLVSAIVRALDELRSDDEHLAVLVKLSAWKERAKKRIEILTPRQHEIMDMLLAGHPSKNIAADLGISQRAVESHRAQILKQTGTKTVAALARLALAATWDGNDEPTINR